MVDQATAAIGQHALKIFTFRGGSTGDALVGIDIDQCPIFLAGDQRGIISVLRSKGIELIL